MPKRTIEEEEAAAALKAGERPRNAVNGDQAATLDFEDEFEDEYESEDETLEAGVDGRPDAEREAESKGMFRLKRNALIDLAFSLKHDSCWKSPADLKTHTDAMEIDPHSLTGSSTFIPGRSTLLPGQTLSPDPSTYEMLHNLSTPWPCLSFSVVRDTLGSNRTSYPRTVYAVAGTQAGSSRAKDNELMILRLSSLSKMEKQGRETDSESSDDDDDDDDNFDGEGSLEPVLESRSIPLPSTTNRIRAFQPPSSALSDPTSMPHTLTATSLENNQILIHDVTPHLTSLSTPGSICPPSASKPISTLRMHKSEGYALDWAPSSSFPLGRLLSGDTSGQIFSTSRSEGGGWVTDTRPLIGTKGSVEEIQWSPSEKHVFASAGTDGCVRVWDVRSKSRKPALSVKVSDADVNVMSWSRLTTHLLATGADDGCWSAWDLRQWKPQGQSQQQQSTIIDSTPIASFNFHKQPITAIEWHPTDDSVIALCSEDGTLTLWDLAVELDDEEQYGKVEEKVLIEGHGEKVPPQLLFIHHVEQAKECHWHEQMPGTVMTTGVNGLGVFKTISV